MEKILVAMSGGVDSSVTALLLQRDGYECMGCTMKLYDSEDLLLNDSVSSPSSSKTCCSSSDVEDARSVATRLNMNFYVLNYKDDFRSCVIDDFVCNYENGFTPNPCIMCNKHLKFGKLLQQAISLGCDKIATGHYARISYEDGKYRLKKALDLSKDQSYVLYNLTQDQLAHTLFPLGELSKADARILAEENAFVNAHKHDSQDICFVPDGDYAGMIERYTGKEFPCGQFIDMDGNVLGQHKGIIHYTIGQRRGLGIAAENRLYVVRLDVDNNTVILGSDDDLYGTHVSIRDFHWIDGDNIPESFRCSAKIRYRMTEQAATVHYEGDGRATIIFDEAQRAATPGQTAVFYDGEYVLGGGIIA